MTDEQARDGHDGRCLPVTEILAGLRTHRERARWLLSVPLGVIQRDHRAISEICKREGFSVGHGYVCAELAALAAVRRRGELPLWHGNTVATLRAVLRREAGYQDAKKHWICRWKFW